MAQGEGFAPPRGSSVEVESYTVANLEVVFSRGQTVRGQVLGVAFEDLPKVVVRVPGAGGVAVSHDGRFTLADLPAGEVVLEASISGTGRRVRRGVVLPRDASEVTLDFDGVDVD